MSTNSTSDIGKEQLKWVQKNQGFAAVCFVWSNFLGLLYHFGEKEKVEALKKLFEPVYNEISKDFNAIIDGTYADSEDKSAS